MNSGEFIRDRPSKSFQNALRKLVCWDRSSFSLSSGEEREREKEKGRGRERERDTRVYAVLTWFYDETFIEFKLQMLRDWRHLSGLGYQC